MGLHMLKEGGGVFQSREEAEEAEHARHKAKQERVAHRKRINWEKRAQAGYTCNLESCNQHFDSMGDFIDHTKHHKEQMKKRLICTHDVSKTTVCGVKFTNRRAYNEHMDEHMEKFKAKTLSGIRSVLLYNKHGLLLDVFEREYKSMMGKSLPYHALGFRTPYDLVTSYPDYVEVQELEDGNMLLVAVPDKNTEHMARMIGNQRENQEGYNYRTGQVIGNQSSLVKRKIEKVTGHRNRVLPPFVKTQIKDMMSLEEYQEGLDCREFLNAYKDLYDYRLEFFSYGFYSVEDLLHHGLEDIVHLQLDNLGGWRILPSQPPSSLVPALPYSVKDKIRTLLSCRPLGIGVCDLPLVYTQLGEELTPEYLGCSDVEELCILMSDICLYIPATKQREATIKPLEETELVSRSPNSNISGFIRRNVWRVLSTSSNGVEERLFLEKYLDIIGECLDVNKHGLKSLKDMFTSLSDSVEMVQGMVRLLESDITDVERTLVKGPRIFGERCWSEVVAVQGDLVYFQRVQDRERLWKLEDEMECYYNGKVSTTILTKDWLVTGMFVVYLDVVEGVWCRGQVVRVMESMVEITSLDYGATLNVHIDCLRMLESRFGVIPALALPVTFTDHNLFNYIKEGQMVWLQVGQDGLRIYTCHGEGLVELRTGSRMGLVYGEQCNQEVMREEKEGSQEYVLRNIVMASMAKYLSPGAVNVTSNYNIDSR